MTDAGIPTGVTVETIYVVEISYAPDAAEKRPPVRPEHLTRVAQLMAEGRLVEAGGFLDFSSALLWVRAASAEDAVALVRDDVYVRQGVWLDDARARPFGRVTLSAAATPGRT
jgi:uncharacterized protein YciI